MSKCKCMSELGREIRVRLAEKNMSQSELSARIGCSPGYLTLIIRGDRSGTKYIEALKKELGLNEKLA